MEWFPRKPQTYRNDTWHLTLAEHGAYTLLIDYYYTSESPLPNNDSALASIIGCSLDDWVAVRDNVTRYFTVSNNMLTHDTCDEVLEAQLSKRKDGANRVAKYRKNKGKTGVTRDKHVSNASRGEERKVEEKKEVSLVSKFDDFWDLFPRQRRGNKAKAKSAYLRVLKECRAKESDISDGLMRYVNSQEVANGYAKGAEAWLNDDRWESDYTTIPKQGGGQSNEINAAFDRAADRIRGAE